MTARRVLALLMLAALMLAPFGRMGAAEARPMPHHQAMPVHCVGQPQPAGDDSAPVSIDCMIACAAMTPAAAPFFAPPPAAEAAPAPIPASALAGIRPDAEPPPPRS